MGFGDIGIGKSDKEMSAIEFLNYGPSVTRKYPFLRSVWDQEVSNFADDLARSANPLSYHLQAAHRRVDLDESYAQQDPNIKAAFARRLPAPEMASVLTHKYGNRSDRGIPRTATFAIRRSALRFLEQLHTLGSVEDVINQRQAAYHPSRRDHVEVLAEEASQVSHIQRTNFPQDSMGRLCVPTDAPKWLIDLRDPAVPGVALRQAVKDALTHKGFRLVDKHNNWTDWKLHPDTPLVSPPASAPLSVANMAALNLGEGRSGQSYGSSSAMASVGRGSNINSARRGGPKRS